MNDIDWAALLARITARNVAIWIGVVAWAAFAFIALSWFASYAWGHS